MKIKFTRKCAALTLAAVMALTLDGEIINFEGLQPRLINGWVHVPRPRGAF